MMKIVNPVSKTDWADPFMTYCARTGYYYALCTRGNRVEVTRSRHAASICEGETREVYRIDNKTVFGCVWAPEMHEAPDGKFYIYTSGVTNPETQEKHLFVLRSLSSDPFDGFEFAGFLGDETVWAIDPTVYTLPDKRQLICYSRLTPGHQVLEIAYLDKPNVLGSARAQIARATYPWETVPPYSGNWTINEGAFFVENKGRLFIIYSGNGCWSDDYCLGVLEYVGGDYVSESAWLKHPEPILTKSDGAFGPGHASFFRSPDGKELWCCYHAMKEHNAKTEPMPRYLNLQKIDFDETGYPVKTVAAARGLALEPPSGEQA